MNLWTSVVSLQRLQDPYRLSTWDGNPEPITRREVKAAIESRRLIACWHGGYTREGHIQRIAYFVVDGWRAPVVVFPRANPPVFDGLHRLAAAIYRKQDWILTHFRDDEKMEDIKRRLNVYEFDPPDQADPG